MNGKLNISSRNYSVASRDAVVAAIAKAGGVYFPMVQDQDGQWMTGGYSVGHFWNVVNTFRGDHANPNEFEMCAERLGTSDLCVVAGHGITVPHVPMLLIRGEEEFESRLIIDADREVVYCG